MLWGRPRSLSPGPAARFDLGLGEIGAVVLALGDEDGVWGHAVVPGRTARALTRHILDQGPGPGFDAPRATTWIERGVVGFAACALADRDGCGGLTIELVEDPPGTILAGVRIRIPLTLRIAGADYRATLAIAGPTHLAPPRRRSIARLLAQRGQRLAHARVELPVVIALGTLPAGHPLRLRDVMLSSIEHKSGAYNAGAQSTGRLFLGLEGDRVPVALAPGGDRVIVGEGHRGGRAVARRTVDPSPVADHESRYLAEKSSPGAGRTRAADSVMVDVTCRIGEVVMSAREVLELEPGQVIPLARPLAGPVDILCGGRILGSGALVDVDGELGVQILSLADEPEAPEGAADPAAETGSVGSG